MKVIADFHIHSKYSRAVSQQMVIPEIANWAEKKGINLVGTGDWTHPLWLRELKANLEEKEEGVFRIKNYGSRIMNQEEEVNFLLTTEISSIYSQGGKLRRIHNLILAPSFDVVDKINSELIKRGANLMSDGRPIVGISSRDLVDLVLSVDKNCLIVPCHVWTPWFSLYGSMSGFDSISECFGEMEKYIYGIETGLSSDPEMNWRIKELENRSILSFSDAHSGQKLGREATVFQIKNEKLKIKNERVKFKINYYDVIGAIKGDSDSNLEIAYTIEFYPEEGKYHFTGHRNCKVRQSPEETKKLGTTCPVCGKPLTIGVMHRVENLSSLEIKVKEEIDEFGVKWISYRNRRPYVMLVPLAEIIAEAENSLVGGQKVSGIYETLINNFGNEFNVLLKTPIEEIEKVAGRKIAEGIKKVRAGDIVVEPGYDGEFGVVKIWKEGRVTPLNSSLEVNQNKQMPLFG